MKIIKVMLNTIQALLIALIAVLLGILGAYLTNWEQKIYMKYLTYILPPIGIAGILFLFIHQETAIILLGIFLMGLSWYQSTKHWFKKK
jgi:hypothetical protein